MSEDQEVRFLEEYEWELLDAFCDGQGIPRISPQFSRAVVALDKGRVVGLMALQLVAHAEPIWLEEKFQGTGLWRELASTLDGYLQQMANAGAVRGVYTQPTRDETRACCEKMGFYEAEHPLYVKLYQPLEVQ